MSGLSIEDKQFLNRLGERLERVEKRHLEEVTDYLEPRLQIMAKGYLQQQGCEQFLFCGGYEQAERKKLIICPEYIEADCSMAGVVLVRCQGKMDYVQANHRDYLGAILGLGIKREKLGDIYVVADGCYLLTSEGIGDYLLGHELRIKGVPLTLSMVETSLWQPPELSLKEIQITVASMRLDNVAAHGFGLSRTKTMEFIQSGKVQVNHLEVIKGDYLCREGDIISFRGQGKLQVATVVGETKKGKLRVGLLKYI